MVLANRWSASGAGSVFISLNWWSVHSSQDAYGHMTKARVFTVHLLVITSPIFVSFVLPLLSSRELLHRNPAPMYGEHREQWHGRVVEVRCYLHCGRKSRTPGEELRGAGSYQVYQAELAKTSYFQEWGHIEVGIADKHDAMVRQPTGLKKPQSRRSLPSYESCCSWSLKL